MEAGLEIRPVRPADAAWVLPLFTANQSILGPASVAWHRFWAGARTRNHWIVIEGLAFVHYRRRLDGVYVIDEIAVDAAAKGRGLGRRLVERIGLPIELKTDADNAESNAFYQRLGFYPAGTKRSKSGKKLFRLWRKG